MLDRIESTPGVAPLTVIGLGSLSLSRSPKGEMDGNVTFAWLADQSEPGEVIALRSACLAVSVVDAHDPILGALRVQPTRFVVEYDSSRGMYEAQFYFMAWRNA